MNVDIFLQLASKYDAELAGQCMKWIKSKIGEDFNTSGDAKNVAAELRSGQKLARLVHSDDSWGLLQTAELSGRAFSTAVSGSATIKGSLAWPCNMSPYLCYSQRQPYLHTTLRESGTRGGSLTFLE